MRFLVFSILVEEPIFEASLFFFRFLWSDYDQEDMEVTFGSEVDMKQTFKRWSVQQVCEATVSTKRHPISIIWIYDIMADIIY